jgi:hypothetical protein
MRYASLRPGPRILAREDPAQQDQGRRNEELPEIDDLPMRLECQFQHLEAPKISQLSLLGTALACGMNFSHNRVVPACACSHQDTSIHSQRASRLQQPATGARSAEGLGDWRKK